MPDPKPLLKNNFPELLLEFGQYMQDIVRTQKYDLFKAVINIDIISEIRVVQHEPHWTLRIGLFSRAANDGQVDICRKSPFQDA